MNLACGVLFKILYDLQICPTLGIFYILFASLECFFRATCIGDFGFPYAVEPFYDRLSARHR